MVEYKIARTEEKGYLISSKQDDIVVSCLTVGSMDDLTALRAAIDAQLKADEDELQEYYQQAERDRQAEEDFRRYRQSLGGMQALLRKGGFQI